MFSGECSRECTSSAGRPMPSERSSHQLHILAYVVDKTETSVNLHLQRKETLLLSEG